MKRFMVRYYTDSNMKEFITKETIKAVDTEEAKEIAEQKKPNNQCIYSIKDITSSY